MNCKLFFVTVFTFFVVSSVWGQQPSARQAPDWVNDGILYQIHPRAFTKEGTLPAATAKLDDLARLGITIVYICPVFLSDDDMRQEYWSPRQVQSGINNPRNPYRMKDYFNVDPEYGTNDDLKAFIKRAHELGMRVLLDIVFFHCGPTAVFLKDHPDFVKRDAEGNIAVGEAWPFPLLNYDNPELREYLWKNLEYWVTEFDADGFRWDVAPLIPLDFVIKARKRLEKLRPDIGMLAEGYAPVNQVEAYDMNFGFPIYPIIRDVLEGKQPASALAKIKAQQEIVQPKGGRFVHYIDNHDLANDDYDERRERRWGTDAVEAALVACFTFDGVPMLYNGQEIADKSRHSIYARMPINWANAETDEGKARFEFLRNLIRVRKEHSALRALGQSNYVTNDQPDAVLSFERYDANEKILVVINFRKDPITVKVQSDIAPLKELLAKGKIVTNTKQPTFDLPGYGWFIGIGSEP